jgi:hypothetical protein
MIASRIIATVVVFTSLSVVALALALIARRYSVAALTIGLAGLLALTTAATWITRTGTANEFAGNRELERLRERNQELEKQIEVTQSERDRALRDLATARDETGRTETALKAEQTKRQEAEDRAKAVEERVAAEQRANPPPATPPRRAMPQPAGTADGLDIRRRLDSHLGTKLYAAQPLEQTELVAGLAGSWYFVRLQRGGKPFVFRNRQFRMPEVVQEIKESALQLQKDILAPIEHVAKRSRLFLRGGADPRPISGATEAPDAREIQILQRLNDATGRYGRDPHSKRPADPVRNEDLPDLRADWLRQQIRTVIPTVGLADIEILENRHPSQDQERTVDLIMYVEW